MYLLENLTWPQAKEAFAKCKTAIIPMGSTEQHGPHLPVGTDFFASQFFADEMTKIDYPAIVTPIMNIGFADYHADFPGTLTYKFETLELIINEICDQLVRYGITHILFFNSHGGNAGPLGRVAYRLRKQGIVAATFMWFEMVGKIREEWKMIGHGEVVETSMVMAYRPGLVDLSKAQRPSITNLTDKLIVSDMGHVTFQDVMTVHFQCRVKDASPIGSMLEPELYPGADKGQWVEDADPKIAGEIADEVLKYFVEFLPEFEKVAFDKIV